MLLESKIPKGVDPKLTENYLLSLTDVADASVWWSSGRLHAHVTVLDHAAVTPRALQRCCLDELGVHQTPHAIVLLQARGPSRAA